MTAADATARWESLLAPLLAAKVLSPLDYRFALALARIAPEPPADAVVLGAAAASAALTRGDICLELARAPELLAPTEEDAPLGLTTPWPEPTAWREALERSPLVTDGTTRAPLVLESGRLYLHRYWDYQRRLARSLFERRETLMMPSPADQARTSATLDRLFASADPDPAQRAAAETAVRRGLTIISGGPGTGKTSTVARILGALVEADPTLRAVLVAPTGKAATRLSESIRKQRAELGLSPELAAKIPDAAATVHRSLGYRPQTPTRFAHDREHPLAADVVVLDEASMVDLAMMTKLVEAVPRRARLILLGDRDQLASVAAGHVLGDIAEAALPGRPLADCFAVLTKSHRFKEDGGIGALARAINLGDEDRVMSILRTESASGPNAELAWQPNDAPDAEQRLRELAVAGWAPLSRRLGSAESALAALPGFQLLCAHRRGRWGAEHLTHEIRLWLAAGEHVPAGEEWYPGRPVIVLVNDHAQDLWNGDTGVVLRDADGLLRVHFPSAAAPRALSLAQLPTHASFYATTIHKAQGSGFDHVVAVLPPEPSPVITRELLYTAVTRARKRVTLVASEAVIRHAVRTRVQRASGLAAALSLSSRPR